MQHTKPDPDTALDRGMTPITCKPEEFEKLTELSSRTLGGWRRVSVIVVSVAIICLASSCSTPGGNAQPQFFAPPVSDDATDSDVQRTVVTPEQRNDSPDTHVKSDNIRDPGPDFGYFPNDGNVLSPGSIYLETALTFESPGNTQSDSYVVPFLFRAGLVNNLELRLFGAGQVDERHSGSNEATGSDSIGLGFRYFLSDGNPRPFGWPSVGLEAQFQKPVGSNAPADRDIQPSASLNFVNVLPAEFSFIWDIGAEAPVDESGNQFAQGQFDWALNYAATSNLALFLTGFVNHPATDARSGTEASAGGGLTWIWNDRLASSLLYSVGLTSESSDVLTGANLSISF
jgi:hypothetical protein